MNNEDQTPATNLQPVGEQGENLFSKDNAIKAKAEWLVKCLEFGWTKEDLDDLSIVWDKFRDEHGKLRSMTPNKPLPEREEVKAMAQEYADRVHPFVWPKNKDGEHSEQRVGQNAPGSAKHRREQEKVIAAFIAGRQSATPSPDKMRDLLEWVKQQGKDCLSDYVKADDENRDGIAMHRMAFGLMEDKIKELIDQPDTKGEGETLVDALFIDFPCNRPLYFDSGLWQLRSDDMEQVLVQQGVNESLVKFIDRCKSFTITRKQ